ncbi:MAG: PspC domain-containing protein [Actinobacteria bacterium]|nr:PspC domain-containing protein [Actinomycetota bacterium]
MVWAQSGRTLTVPRKGTKLYRKREEKWIAGVLGGLAEYLGVDATLLRLAFLALVLVFDVGGLVVAYIIMAILVPLEPQAVAVTTAPAPPPDGDATGNA